MRRSNGSPATTAGRLLSICREIEVPLASHDDTIPEHVIEAAQSGVSISEFPTTYEAARMAAELGLKIMAGAPNLIRGGSHSANVSASDLASGGLIDLLSSDYFPAGLLQGAFCLHRNFGQDLPRALARITAIPARTGRTRRSRPDRGRTAGGFDTGIVPGRSADCSKGLETGAAGRVTVRGPL